MLTGAVEVYANHAFVIIGSGEWPELVWDDGPGSADGRHVVIRTRGQTALTRVAIWSGAMPLLGEPVFDGQLDLADHTIWVGDLERLGRWAQRINQTGVQRVVVCVDDPLHASRVHVGLDIDRGAQVRAVPPAGGPVLFEVLSAETGDLARPAELGLVLDGHDVPHARLRTAIGLLSGPDPARPWLERHEIGRIVEWLRWLAPDLGWDRASALGEELRLLVRGARAQDAEVPPGAAARIATTVLGAVQERPDR
ncbi:hypothetical protein CS0771_62760 [Catellatospora sp. IY07-71]|uniref:hypothetical protein n=1 Tax=Catellatospora sp. IY07-71 TaxID=2728827 RepID=UPI001BB3AD2A|nr:hypothetical protein [Catellatospora sp. IY07-71]BCJ76732.1 hypothetical protein CS0771_62760 [Catellatospora sp. IY07-71]